MRPEFGSSTLAAATAVPGESRGSPFQRPGLLARAAPFAAVAAMAEASLALPPGPQSSGAVIASVVLLAATAAAFALPWSRLPAWMRVLVPLAYTASALALILAAGPTSGVGIVILIPLAWTALFHRRWESACIVIAIVTVEVIISLAPVRVSDAVIARRVLLWALLGTLISVAAHGLRDRIGRGQAEQERLQNQLRELTVIEERERIAASLRDSIAQQIFAAGLNLQAVANLTAEAEVRRRVDASVEDLDRAVRMLRDAVLGLEARPRSAGLRQQVLALCRELSPVPEIRFTAEAGTSVPALAQAQALGLLRESFRLIGPDSVPRRVEVGVAGDACEVTIDASSRDDPTDGLTPGEDFSGLLERVRRAGIQVDIATVPGGVRVGWRLPLGRPARSAAEG